VDRPIPVPGPCLRAEEVPPDHEDQPPLLFYFCIKEWLPETSVLEANQNVFCIKRLAFEELILRIEAYQDLAKEVRERCVEK
jgi:hypothetical protein